MEDLQKHPLEELYLERLEVLARRMASLEAITDPTAKLDIQNRLQTIRALSISNELLRYHFLALKVTLLFIRN